MLVRWLEETIKNKTQSVYLIIKKSQIVSKKCQQVPSAIVPTQNYTLVNFAYNLFPDHLKLKICRSLTSLMIAKIQTKDADLKSTLPGTCLLWYKLIFVKLKVNRLRWPTCFQNLLHFLAISFYPFIQLFILAIASLLQKNNYINKFHVTILFLYPLIISENQRLSSLIAQSIYSIIQLLCFSALFAWFQGL